MWFRKHWQYLVLIPESWLNNVISYIMLYLNGLKLGTYEHTRTCYMPINFKRVLVKIAQLQTNNSYNRTQYYVKYCIHVKYVQWNTSIGYTYRLSIENTYNKMALLEIYWIYCGNICNSMPILKMYRFYIENICKEGPKLQMCRLYIENIRNEMGKVFHPILPKWKYSSAESIFHPDIVNIVKHIAYTNNNSPELFSY